MRWLTNSVAIVRDTDSGSQLQTVLAFANDDLVLEMCLQTMNYVVKHGWEPNRGEFVYSEASREGSGNWNLIVYPLAYLGRVYRTGNVKHPEWYDTAPQWLEIATRAYDDWKYTKERGDTDLGFYGYEFVFPSDFFAIMAALEEAGALNR